MTYVKGGFFYLVTSHSIEEVTWLSVADQVTLLESRGLLIDDRALAEEFLEFANYYRFSGYCLAFQDRNHHFRAGAKFSDIVYAYRFYSDLRSLVGDWLELAEIDLRTPSVHLFSEKYQAFGHLPLAIMRSIPGVWGQSPQERPASVCSFIY